jgi:hypothetical protein
MGIEEGPPGKAAPLFWCAKGRSCEAAERRKPAPRQGHTLHGAGEGRDMVGAQGLEPKTFRLERHADTDDQAG